MPNRNKGTQEAIDNMEKEVAKVEAEMRALSP
jgi:hypothetical protein